jgi:hypothetical protein
MALRSNGWCSRGPCRELGSRVHGRPHLRGTPRFDLNYSQAIARSWTRACKGRWRARRRQGRRGGASPEDRRRALDCCTGHHFVHTRTLHEDRKHAHMPRRLGARRRRPRWPAPEGGGPPRRRARGAVVVRRKKGKGSGEVWSPRE